MPIGFNFFCGFGEWGYNRTLLICGGIMLCRKRIGLGEGGISWIIGGNLVD
jgi:hypothetical protein